MAGQDQLLTGFNVHTALDRDEMLAAIGAGGIEDLFSSIPPNLRLGRDLDLAPALNEWQLEARIEELTSRNATASTHLSLLGGGAYQHHIPAVVDAICSRGEFLTAYTPYQPEMSQGLLQALAEYQQMLGLLTGLSTVNCSLYDGATAVAEAAWMACAITKRRKVLAVGLWPVWQEVLATYMRGRNVRVEFVEPDTGTGTTSQASLGGRIDEGTACVIVQSPNRFGIFEDLEAFASLAHRREALAIVSPNPMSLAIVEPPGKLGADIVAAEGQCLGIPLSAGGPYLGILATKPQYEGFMPGRLVGRLTDLRGQRAYALVKEEREQHVSRDRATSHICSNQALQAIRAAVYLATLGESGFRTVAQLSAVKAHWLRERLVLLPGVSGARSGAFFNEFAIALPIPADLFLERMLSDKIFAGIKIDDRSVLLAVTEVRSRADLERVVERAAHHLARPEGNLVSDDL